MDDQNQVPPTSNPAPDINGTPTPDPYAAPQPPVETAGDNQQADGAVTPSEPAQDPGMPTPETPAEPEAPAPAQPGAPTEGSSEDSSSTDGTNTL